jgi:quercetin dioxygenase-like cupin family protein
MKPTRCTRAQGHDVNAAQTFYWYRTGGTPLSAATLSRPSTRLLILLIGVAVALVIAGAAALLAPSRASADHVPVHPTNLARAPFAIPTDIKLKSFVGDKHVVANAPNAADTLVQQIVVQPGGFTGWHTHPGPVIVIVNAGTFTYYAGDDPTCTGIPYGPGEAFVDPGQGHVHSARNEGTTPMVAYAIYFDIPSTLASPFIAADNPGNCSF